MADSTEYVNYPVFNTYETDISNNGFNLREQMETAFKALAGLNNGDGWKGPQYDEVVKSYNSVKGNLDQICKDITENTIPADFAGKKPHKVWEFELTNLAF